MSYLHVFKKKNLTLQATSRTRPMVTENFNDHAQIDLIDFQSVADGDYKWVLHYQGHLTKFSIFRLLRTKHAEEVAAELKQIFCIFGCPRVLHSDNGREFVNKVIDKLVSQWPGCQNSSRSSQKSPKPEERRTG